ncbi:MAG TPA: MBL fold metallo-hydrolase RNA specificity domain-containing protein [Vicinamibacteria bacterium]
MRGVEAIRIHGEHVPVRAEVIHTDGLSDRGAFVELLDWLRGMKRTPARTFVTRGEPGRLERFPGTDRFGAGLARRGAPRPSTR